MKLRSPISQKKARIEIIPLIDIMFFLLACFMLVSLSMVQMRGVKIALPSASTASPDKKNDFHPVTVDALGKWYWEKEETTPDALFERVKTLLVAEPEARFYIRGDKNALHGEVMHMMDVLKKAGVAKVSFELETGK